MLDNEMKLPCDDHYLCDCGAEFRAYSTPEVHFTMPQNIAGKETPEPIEINLPLKPDTANIAGG